MISNLTYPCPRCGYDVRAQVEQGITRCPECGGELPDVRYHCCPSLAWLLATGQDVLRDEGRSPDQLPVAWEPLAAELHRAKRAADLIVLPASDLSPG